MEQTNLFPATSRGLSLSAEVFLLFAEGKITKFPDYKDLAEFLGVYNYNIIYQRHLEEGLIEELFYWKNPKTSPELFFLHHVIAFAETCLKKETQKEIIHFIQTHPSNRIELFLKEERNEYRNCNAS